MNQKKFRLSILAAACAALTLAACGGGGGSASVTASSTSSSDANASGTVTGFGSVIVDGVRIDDRSAVAMTEADDDSMQVAELKIGQHVEVEHDANLSAKTIRIVPDLQGIVTGVDATAGTLTVLNQTIKVNSDATAGPVTVFDAPYQTLADVKVNDAVEIHGFIKVDTTGKMSIQATRIEQKASVGFLRVRGKVSELSATASTFKIGDLLVSYAGAKVTPTGVTLANGMEVRIWIPSNPTFTGSAVDAAKVKVRGRKAESGDLEVKLGGAVSKIDAAAKTFVVDGVTVDASGATFEQSGKGFADIKDGSYVRVKGTYTTDGTFKAASISLRAFEKSKGVELHGSALNFKSNADFTLRGLEVDASKATVECNAAALTENTQIEVEGSLSADGKVIATEVKCESVQEGTSIVERSGTAGKIDLTARTLVVTSGQQTVNVQWTATTLFVGVEQGSLDGKTVKVEGVLSGGVLRATKIKLAVK
ncbi:hypothetical protein EGT07_15365 [Herbaspirillum sp. HC18]|nr:hypothetical protein EGT07_15365 [Herbaspirillum sp. HC18]